ncbi:MAG TPA: DUF2795 domain-containing protein [Actinocatenispora sp.]
MTLALAADARTVTRTEIADHVETAFTVGAADRDALLATARTAGARAEVLAVLATLPDRHYAELRQLWTDLADVPIGR